MVNDSQDEGQEVALAVGGGVLRFSAPADWEVDNDTAAPVASIVLEPSDGQPFRASMVLTLDELPADLDFNGWQKGVEIMLAQQPNDWLLIDLERVQVAGAPGARRLGTFAAPTGLSVTSEQWMTIVGGRGVTLTATSATMLYPFYGPLLQAKAQSLAFEESVG